MRASLSGLPLAAAASTATAHAHHKNYAKSHQEYAREAAVGTSTLKDKWLYGYQGWFRKPAAGVNIHWSPNGGTPGPGNVEFEFVPDGVVDLHFKWMQQYGIDGAIIQRFLSHLDDASFITVLNQVQAAAVKYGRGFMVEYDASGGNSATGSVAAKILADYSSKVKPYTTSPAYIHHNGKPAVMVFGVGYPTVPINVTDGANIATQLKGAGAEGGYMNGYHTTTQIPDTQTLHSLGIDHAPLIWPGTSAYHLDGADAITSLVIKPLFAFNAMCDEINEGTQSLPCLKTNQLPTNEKFVGYENNFADSAFYLKLGGQKAAAFAAAVK
ncbi:hypothetical protein V8C42DRAFT_343122 [Trichoderma barbatum]